MTEQKWLFVGTDKRMSLCSQIMMGRGHTCRVVNSDAYTAEFEKELKEFSPQHIVLPIHQLIGTIPVELLNKETQLYTGIATDDWLKTFENSGVSVHHYLQEEQFIWENARLTAEALIAVYYARTERAIAGNSFSVAGYGRVGKMVADTLAALGGQVTIVARSATQLGEAATRGFKVRQLAEDLEFDRFLINTIPKPWLLVKPNSNLFIFDLASVPGCLRDASAPEYYTLLPGLPGKYFAHDAATALADGLERIYRR